MHEEKVLMHYRLTGKKKKRIKGNENKFGLGVIGRDW